VQLAWAVLPNNGVINCNGHGVHAGVPEALEYDPHGHGAHAMRES